MRKLIVALALIASTNALADDYIGSLSRNPFAPDGINNPFSKWNNCFYPDSPCNPYGPYGNPFSPYSANNPFATQAPRVYGGPFNDQSEKIAEMQRKIDAMENDRLSDESWRLLEENQRLLNAETELLLEAYQ